ncbi:MAG: Cd(II)/Pb(II)-responsive transcriptional regulator [Acidobacteriota bacterium]
MKIGELANLTDTSVETIRFYEREGLLAVAARTSSNYRVYDAPHVDQLIFIRHCRSLDMALDEIRALLSLREKPHDSCEAVNKVLDDHIEHVAQRIQELKALQKQLSALRAQCGHARDVEHCGILSGLSQATCAASGASAQRHVASVHGRKR